MSDILLRELSNADIDWIVTIGNPQSIAPEKILINPGETLNKLYVLLEGSLSVHLTKTQTLEESQEIVKISRGEIFGESWLFNLKPVVLVIAVEHCKVLNISKSALLDKLHQDIGFAAHFYRALALIMTERIRKILEPNKNMLYSSQVVKEALFIFGELRDSDIDWIVSTGKIRKLRSGEVLLPAGHSIDTLYIVLDGRLTAAITNEPFDPLSMCFSKQESLTENQSFQIVAYVSRGRVPGISSFLDFQPLRVTYQAETESLVLAIPRQQVAIKLQEDLGFASRFYRVIATQVANFLRTAYLLQKQDSNGSFDLISEDEDELHLDELQRVSEGGTKFNWMLRQLGVSCV